MAQVTNGKIAQSWKN